MSKFVVYHRKDNDGNISGAICKYKYPDAEMLGWDYLDEVPNFEQFRNKEVIMIDVTFPIDKILELNEVVEDLTIIDHHISFKKSFDNVNKGLTKYINYIYEDGIAACEIGWKYLFPDRFIPKAVELASKYDTWREYGTNQWNNEILPFKYGILSDMNTPDGFNPILFEDGNIEVWKYIEKGATIMKYEQMMHETIAKSFVFEREAFGLRAICLNYFPFSSETLKSIYDESKHDIMVGFVSTGTKWSVSLRSTKDEVDVSVITKTRGGGGHTKSAGFECENFENIFL